MRAIFFFIVFIFLPFLVNAQCDSTKWAQEGTYQLIRINRNSEATTISRTPLTGNQLCMIEENRQDYAYAYLDLDPYTRVKIFPKYISNNSTER